jgi:SAM-dependent methyltransferase
MYQASARVNDALYRAAVKDYAAEAAEARAVIEARRSTPAATLLDVGCGTGAHLEHLARWYAVEGLDLSPEMLAVARERCPGVPLHCADMADFALGKRFDVVVSLFSSIGYVRTIEGLHRAVHAMADHLLPGGVLAIEPWLTPEECGSGGMGALCVDEPGLKAARVHANTVDGRLLIMNWHLLVGTPEGVEYVTERHETGLFTDRDYRDAFAASGLEAEHQSLESIRRGLYVASLPT